MFTAWETVALPSQLSNEPPFSVSLSQGGRIKHVLNGGARHFDRDKLMCGRRWAPSRGLAGGVCWWVSLKQLLPMTDSVNFILPLSRIKNTLRGIWLWIKTIKMPKGQDYLKLKEKIKLENCEFFLLLLSPSYTVLISDMSVVHSFIQQIHTS